MKCHWACLAIFSGLGNAGAMMHETSAADVIPRLNLM